jgi:hypothetical protein
MKAAVAAVFLVSDNFLASDFIMEEEVPFLLDAHRTRHLMIFWAYLEPCDIKRYPEIMKFQAMSGGKLEPMAKMNDWKWKTVMLKGCDMIDEFLKESESPVINPAIKGKPFPRISENLVLLAKPARRDVEVLVYAGNKWWRQSRIKVGATTTKIYLGNNETKKGTTFSVVAITSEEPLTLQTYSNLPNFRTKSEFTLIRG